MLKDLTYRISYRTNKCDFDTDFMIPCYTNSNYFERGSGFFTLSSLVRSFDGLLPFIENGGIIHLVCSPKLKTEDIALIDAGLTGQEATSCMIEEIKRGNPDLDLNQMDVICNMINEERLIIKVAFMEHGMYHEKFGIFTDEEGNRVAYTGSNNESLNAKDGNYESFDPVLSWEGNRDLAKIEDHQEHFRDMWNNKENGLVVMDFPEVVKANLFEAYKTSGSLAQAIEQFKGKNTGKKQLYQYQKEAIREFCSNGYVHFYEMATGTGKTFTAVKTITELRMRVSRPIFVIICVPQIDLQVQWQKALEEEGYDDVFLMGGIAGTSTDKNISESIIVHSDDEDVICVSTYDTFFSKVCQRIRRIKDLFIIVDEAHNLTPNQIKNLPPNIPYRLGLSATIQRFSANETMAIVKYFTKEGCKPFYYGIEEAIANGFLSHYEYYPIFVNMSEVDFCSYQKKTNAIAVEMSKDEEEQDLDLLNRLRNERSLIVKKSSIKLEKLEEMTNEGFNFVNSVVYCGQGKEGEDSIIDLVTKILHEARLSVHTFTSKTIDRPKVLKEFEGGFFDVLVAIKCFDEGVDVPKLDKIYIMASDSALRQTVQRRGRVLRQCRATGKEMAFIYDMVVLPPQGYYIDNGAKSLVMNEFRRVLEYNRLSSNLEINNFIITNYLNKYEITENDINHEND